MATLLVRHRARLAPLPTLNFCKQAIAKRHNGIIMDVPSSLSSVTTLCDGVKMPLFGLGCWLSENDGEMEMAALHALKSGYRLIDTAAMYGNEEDVGKAVKKSGLKREDIFVVTKLKSSDHGYQNCLNAFHRSLERLDIGYVDLYLIHTNIGGKILETYDAMLKLKNDGLIRSVGVSNFGIQHLEGLRQAGKPTPSVNQIEIHPYHRYEDLVEYCRKHQIGVMGFCPLARCKKFSDPQLIEIAKRYPGKTVSQIMLRWSIQSGVIPIPKSSNPGRIEENAKIFDFSLSEEDMKLMNNFPFFAASAASSHTDEPWTG